MGWFLTPCNFQLKSDVFLTYSAVLVYFNSICMSNCKLGDYKQDGNWFGEFLKFRKSSESFQNRIYRMDRDYFYMEIASIPCIHIKGEPCITSKSIVRDRGPPWPAIPKYCWSPPRVCLRGSSRRVFRLRPLTSPSLSLRPAIKKHTFYIRIPLQLTNRIIFVIEFQRRSRRRQSAMSIT